MNSIITYITALTATALIGVLVINIIKDERINRILQISMGILIILVLLKPVASLKIDELGEEIGNIFREEFQTQDYESLYQDKLRTQVKSVTEDYVQKKAESIGAEITVEVGLSAEGYPAPHSIRIVGALSGEQKRILLEYITNDLGIAPENQRWDLYDKMG